MFAKKQHVEHFFEHTSLELQINPLYFQNIEKFNQLVENLASFMQYIDINEKWETQNNSSISIAQNTYFISQLKKKIRYMLLSGITNNQYCNIIFMFHHHVPLSNQFHLAYKLLINTLLENQAIQEGICVELILSIYLHHAATYNHYEAIKILIENYNVSPIQTWTNIFNIYPQFNLNIMPIIQVTNPTHVNLNYRCFMISKQQQQQIFLYMLHKINITDENIRANDIQNIFRCAFRHLFKTTINYLLNQPCLCKNIDITEHDIIMFAFGCIIIPTQYYNLIDIILTHHNIIVKRHLNIPEIKIKIDFFIKELNNLLIFNFNPNSNIALNVVADFIKIFLEFKQHNNNNLVPENYNNNLTTQLLMASQRNFALLQQKYIDLCKTTTTLQQERNFLLNQFKSTSFLKSQNFLQNIQNSNKTITARRITM